jgi:hypothetical protein
MATNPDNKVIDRENLTTRSMSIFFTLTFPNVLRKTCPECQDHFRENGYSGHLTGDSQNGIRDVSYKYHCHFPSYSYVISRARNISSFFHPKNTQIVVEGDPNYLKKYEAYLDEHKLRGVFSKKDNSRVTRPHVHGIIKNIDYDNFWRILSKTNYFQEFWQPGCACFEPTIVKNNDWVYKVKQDVNRELLMQDHRPANTCINPYKEIKPIGFYKIEPVKNDEAVETYIQKYIDKGGQDVQIF